MKILYASKGCGPHDVRFIRAGVASGCRLLHLIVAPRGSHELTALQRPDTLVVTVKDFSERVASISRVVEAFAPDVIHAGPLQEVAFPVQLAAGSRPFVSMSWGSDLMLEAQRDGLWADVAGYVLSRSTHFIADCRSVLQVAQGLGYLGPSTVFPWGIDVENFQPEGARQPLALSGPVILSSRNWQPVYDVQTLAQAFCTMQGTPSLVLVGSGSEEAALRALLAPLTATGRVAWPGQVPNDQLPAWYRAADVYVSTSRTDGSSVSLLEAMGCGLPVVVSDIPANREWVNHGENGLLFPVGDVEALAARLEDVLSLSPEARAMMGRVGRRYVVERADWAVSQGQLGLVYETAAALNVQQRSKETP